MNDLNHTFGSLIDRMTKYVFTNYIAHVYLVY